MKTYMRNNFTIGVLGGMGTYATIYLFKKYAEVFPAIKEWDRPRIIIDNRCTMPSRVRAFLYGEEKDRLIYELTDSIQSLKHAGCDKIILACNTSHLFLPVIYEKHPELEDSVLNIINVCVEQLQKDCIREVFLLATEATIESSIYQKTLNRFGIKCMVPKKEEFPKLRKCIEAVKQNRFNDEIKDAFLELINCYPVCILGCTELPVLYEKYREDVTCEKVYDALLLGLYILKQMSDRKEEYVDNCGVSERYSLDTGIGSGTNEYKIKLPDVILYNISSLSDAMQLPRVNLESELTVDAFTLLHFSDIHGDVKCLKNIQIVKDYMKDYIDDAICTGDFVSKNWYSDTGFWNQETDGTILTCIGNHDVLLGDSDNIQPSEEDIYHRFIGPYVNYWGENVSQTYPNLYYYKDYPEKAFRLIVLNVMYYEQEKVDKQNKWLENVLKDAKEKSYSVVIAEHSYPDQAQRICCTFSSLTRFPESTMKFSFQKYVYDYQVIVQRFIDYGGDFICFLCGHRHADYIAYTKGYERQTFIGVAGALCYNNMGVSEYDYGTDARRISAEKSMDCFNIVSFDKNAHIIKLVRIGCDRDLYMRHRGILVLDYSTAPATVIYND